METNFLTHKWLVGVLLAIVMGTTGYYVADVGVTHASFRTQITEAADNAKIVASELAVERARSDAQYREIIRRLDRIENSIDRATEGRKSASLRRSGTDAPWSN